MSKKGSRISNGTPLVIVLVCFTILPMLVLGIFAIRDVRDLGQTSINDASEMGMTAIQDSRDSLLKLASQQLLLNTVALTQQLNEAMDTRFNDILALAQQPLDEETCRRFLELHVGKIHDPQDSRTSDVEYHPDKTLLSPVFRGVYLLDLNGNLQIKAVDGDAAPFIDEGLDRRRCKCSRPELE